MVVSPYLWCPLIYVRLLASRATFREKFLIDIRVRSSYTVFSKSKFMLINSSNNSISLNFTEIKINSRAFIIMKLKGYFFDCRS